MANLQSFLPSGFDKSHICIHDILKVIHFQNCHTWLLFNKYICEHTFPVYWVCKATYYNGAVYWFPTLFCKEGWYIIIYIVICKLYRVIYNQSSPFDACNRLLTHQYTCHYFDVCKNSMHHFCLWHLLPETLEQRKWKNKQKISMYDIQIRENSQFAVITIISFAYINLLMYPS